MYASQLAMARDLTERLKVAEALPDERGLRAAHQRRAGRRAVWGLDLAAHCDESAVPYPLGPPDSAWLALWVDEAHNILESAGGKKRRTG